MPSKGVQTYTYVGSGTGNAEISISVPKQAAVRRDKQVFQSEDFEIDAAKIKWPLKRVGRYQFQVRQDGKTLTEQWMDVDPITGIIRSESTMDDIMLETRSVLDGELAISYGVYAAGSGQAGLPSRHQAYITVSRNWSLWQGLVAPLGSEAETRPFGRLVLPCPHDVGMNSMATINAILAHAGNAAAKILANLRPFLAGAESSLGKLLTAVSDATVAKIAPAIIASLAVTQKDTLATMLALGARYFEFRPAHCHTAILPYSPLPDKLYFQHGPIPGMAYDQFLIDLVLFLAAHPTEIAVVHVRWDGVPAECARPSEAERNSYLDAALAISGGSVRAGTVDDLRHATIRELRASGKRLLLVVDDGGVLGTYDDNANATIDGRSILTKWQDILTSNNQEGKTMTVAQVQATTTNIKDVVYYSVITAGVSTMALMSTKATCDNLILPWARENLVQRLKRDQTLVIMDDFIDGALTDVCVDLSAKRLA